MSNCLAETAYAVGLCGAENVYQEASVGPRTKSDKVCCEEVHTQYAAWIPSSIEVMSAMTVCSPLWSANIINVGRMSGNAGVRWRILPAGSVLVATGDFTRATGELRQLGKREACTRFESAAMFECVKSTIEDCLRKRWKLASFADGFACALRMALLVENMGWHARRLVGMAVCWGVW